MRIITWNCNMAFRKKADLILKFKPDILVVPECEHPDKIIFKDETLKPKSMLWGGANPNKGIGIFSFGNYHCELLEIHNPDFKNILPIKVSNGKNEFTLFAIWANNPKDKDGVYVTQIWKAVHYYDELLSNSNTILVGDFNSNTIWDKPKRIGNHSHLVNKLKEKGISSCYHEFYKQEQGKEAHPTLFMYRHEDKPYHIDYCFASYDFMKKLKNVEVGNYKDWSSYSDHKPLIVDFEI